MGNASLNTSSPKDYSTILAAFSTSCLVKNPTNAKPCEATNAKPCEATKLYS